MPKVDRLQQIAEPFHVRVRIDEAGNHSRSVRVDAFGLRAEKSRRVIAGVDDLSVAHGKGGGDGKRGVEGIDAGSGNDHIGRLGGS